mgnify:FL=1
MKVDYNILANFFDYDELYLEFDRVINNINTIDMEYGIDIIFKYYRKTGFPHYQISETEKHNHVKKMINFNVDTIFKDDVIVQTMHGLRLAWSYFPHFWEVKCGNTKTAPIDNYIDDDLFKTAIKKTWQWELKHWGGGVSGYKFHENRLRQALKISNTQAVSNFRPTAAKVIYENYGGDGVIWDMSCGWGGRLLGFLSSPRAKHYIGTEPSSKTFDGLLKIKEDFSYLNKKIEIHKLGSEVFRPKQETLDLCFTSPPYFDTEKYSDEGTQSYIKFPSSDEWLDGFLRKTIENCYYCCTT